MSIEQLDAALVSLDTNQHDYVEKAEKLIEMKAMKEASIKHFCDNASPEPRDPECLSLVVPSTMAMHSVKIPDS